MGFGDGGLETELLGVENYKDDFWWFSWWRAVWWPFCGRLWAWLGVRTGSTDPIQKRTSAESLSVASPQVQPFLSQP